MSSDPDIHFGELEEEQPDVALRPDRNAHFAIAVYGELVEHELPIFVDLDVLIEMESHALSDTSVELGGVMLGGQLHDEDGQPYILVQDSLRAEHYEATKGSFKFTHDTWQQITRKRDEFPENWDMVGWYHTHPDWGVFLSGMDMFICDNFFNKPLDIALVIDPCRQDRGFFQWVQGAKGRERKHRVGGFYVIASRHRQAELEQFIDELEGGYTMRTDPKLRGGYQVASGQAPTVVNITEQRPGWLGQAVVMTMVVQTLLILLVAFLALSQRTAGVPPGTTVALSREAEEVKLRTRVLDDVISALPGGTEGVVASLQEERARGRLLEDKLAVAEAGVPSLRKQLAAEEARTAGLNKAVDALKEDYSELEQKYFALNDEARSYRGRLEALTQPDGVTAEAAMPWWKWLFTSWQGITLCVVVLAVVGLGGVLALRNYPLDEPFDEPPGGRSPADSSDPADQEDQSPREREETAPPQRT